MSDVWVVKVELHSVIVSHNGSTPREYKFSTHEDAAVGGLLLESCLLEPVTVPYTLTYPGTFSMPTTFTTTDTPPPSIGD